MRESRTTARGSPTSTTRERNPTISIRTIAISLFVLSLGAGLAACNDTYKGAKKDTGENLESTGKAIEKTGSDVKD